MAAFEITRIRTEPARSGTHEHVAVIWLRAGFELPRSTVVMDLRTPGGDRYYTTVDERRAYVIATSCPDCGFRDYLTTEADTPRANDLLALPEF